MKNHLAFVFAISAALTLSCRSSVVEDRQECPAFLFFEIQNDEAQFDPAENVYVSAFTYPEGDFLASDTTKVRAIRDGSFYLPVKRTESAFGYGVLGFDKCRLSGEMSWMVREGEDFDRIFRFSYHTPAYGEKFIVPVELLKDHCRITVKFNNYDRFSGTSGQFPFRALVKGNTCGIDAQSGVPLKGAFFYEPEETPGGTFSFTVPRQFDRSLVLDLMGKEGLFENSGKVVSFDLWHLFNEQENFSWEQKNLPDVYLEIDYLEFSFNIVVVPWQGSVLDYMYEF